MKQFLIFLIGFISIIIAIAGGICAIQTITTGVPFLVVCAVIFISAWGYMVIDWLKSKSPEKVAELIYNKIKNRS